MTTKKFNKSAQYKIHKSKAFYDRRDFKKGGYRYEN